MSHDELSAAGYRKNPAHWSMPHSDYFYHKRFTDERGTKYFINVVHYAADLSRELPEGWRVDIQHELLVFENNNPPSLTEAEALCEKFWREIARGEYYEVSNGSN